MLRDVTSQQVMIDEMKSAFGQVGALRPAQARSAVIRHPGAMHF
jgi:hypothetical protein